MEGVENSANNATKEVKGFVQHLLKFDNDTRADMTNAAQYLALILLPLGMAYNFINTVIPKTDESKGNIVNVPKNKLVVLQGLKDYIVVESDNILLVCRKQDEQEIKQFVSDIKLSKDKRFY